MRRIFTVRIAVVFSLVAWPLAADWEEGIAAFQSGEYATAEAEFRAVIERQPSWPGGHLMLGQTLLRRGHGDQALPHLERAYELAADAQTALALSQAYLHLQRFDDVVRTLQDRDPAGLAPAQQAAFYKTRGLAAIKREQVSSALSDLTRAARAAPRDGEIHYLLATAAKAAGQSGLEITSLEKAAELSPQNVKILHALAGALHRQAQDLDPEAKSATCERATHQAQRLVKLAETYEHLLMLGKTAFCAGHYDEALEPLQRAAAERPQEWLPEYYLGRTFVLLEDWDKATPSLHRILEKNIPEDYRPLVWGQLGYVHEKLQQFDQAIDDHQRAGDPESVARARKNKELQDHNDKLQQLNDEEAQILQALDELASQAAAADPGSHDR